MDKIDVVFMVCMVLLFLSIIYYSIYIFYEEGKKEIIIPTQQYTAPIGPTTLKDNPNGILPSELIGGGE